MKKIISLLVCILMITSVVSACGNTPAETTAAPEQTTQAAETTTAAESTTAAEETTAPDSGDTYDLSGKKIGVTFYDLTNPIWAATGEHLVNYGKSLGAEVTLVSCEGNPSMQLTQVETMIEAGMDIIVIGPQDANSLGAVIKKAQDAGILIMAYGQSMEGVDAQYVVENYDAGYKVGTAAGEWINEHLGGEAEVGMLDYPLMEDIIFRANGIIDGLAAVAPNAKIVATATSADPVSGMDAVENFLQANPNMKVITCIGDGGALGANEAVKSAGKATDDFGIFSCDGTAEVLTRMMDGDPIRMTVGLGTPTQKAEQVVNLAAKMILGLPFDFEEYTPMDPVSLENAQEYWDAAGY